MVERGAQGSMGSPPLPPSCGQGHFRILGSLAQGARLKEGSGPQALSPHISGPSLLGDKADRLAADLFRPLEV